LGRGRDVLFSEFGVPTSSANASREAPPGPGPALVEEPAAAAYVERALDALLASGSSGAMLWSCSDYDSALWRTPPLDLAVHERSFGVWRSDGSPKPAVAAIAAFAARATSRSVEPALPDGAWLDIERDHYYRSPESELPRLYKRFCAAFSNDADDVAHCDDSS
jgi:hypothetical protein